MTDGMIGADPEQLRELAKSMETSGSTLKQLSASLNSVITGARWSGTDSDRFRSQWHNGMRSKLHSTGDVLAQYSTILRNQADEQVQASAAGGFGPGTGSQLPAGPGDRLPAWPGDDAGANLSLDDLVDASSNSVYQSANLLASISGTFADVVLGKLVQAGVLRESSWALLSARTGQLGQYAKGTQLLNGLSMLGRAAGVLSIIGGGAQFADGLMNGDTNQMLDGGITTVLAAGSFIPVVGPAFAVAGIAWAGAGMLANSMGYDSTSEMVGDGAKWVGGKAAEGAGWIGEQSANVAKKAWGWLSGG